MKRFLISLLTHTLAAIAGIWFILICISEVPHTVLKGTTGNITCFDTR